MTLVVICASGARFFSWVTFVGVGIAISGCIALRCVDTTGPTVNTIAYVGCATVGASVLASTYAVTLVRSMYKAFDTGLFFANCIGYIQLTGSVTITDTIGSTGSYR